MGERTAVTRPHWRSGPLLSSPRRRRAIGAVCYPQPRRARASLGKEAASMTTTDVRHDWPGSTLARVPYWVYQDEANYRAELRRIFEGPVWNYLCLESDVARR